MDPPTILPAIILSSQFPGNNDPKLPHKFAEENVKVVEITFVVPLDHFQTDRGTIQLSGRVVYQPSECELKRDLKHTDLWERRKKYFLYLCGGPGSENPETDFPHINEMYLKKGYYMLYLDYRGCGKSSQINLKTANQFPSPYDLKQHLKLFTQLEIAYDIEAVRLCLAGWMRCRPVDFKFTALCQSYGGWIAMSYLSQGWTGFDALILTAGMPPIGKSAVDVYKKTFQTVFERQQRMFADPAYNKTEDCLRKIIKLLRGRGNGILLQEGKNGFAGCLTIPRLFGIGRSLGTREGFGEIFRYLQDLLGELEELEKPECRKKLEAAGDDPQLSVALSDQTRKFVKYDTRPLYAILHHLIYDGTSAVGGVWPAELAARSKDVTGAKDDNDRHFFWWLHPDLIENYNDNFPLNFCGEHVFQWAFEDWHGRPVYPGLQGFHAATKELVENWTDRPPLYNEDMLKQTETLVLAYIVQQDMYVAVEYSVAASMMLGNHISELDEEAFHAAVKHATVGPKLMEGWKKRMRDEKNFHFDADLPKALPVVG